MPTAQQVGLKGPRRPCPCSSCCGTGSIFHLLAHILDPATSLLGRQQQAWKYELETACATADEQAWKYGACHTIPRPTRYNGTRAWMSSKAQTIPQ